MGRFCRYYKYFYAYLGRFFMYCEKCKNTTFISEEKDGETIAVPCECRKEKEEKINLDTKLIGARIPRIFWGYTLEEYITMSKEFLPLDVQSYNSSSLVALKRYIDRPELIIEKGIQSIWIWGLEDNSCHTTLAIILGTAFIKAGASVRFITMQDLLNAFTDFGEKNLFFQEFDNHKVYIIDDAFDVTRCIARGDYTKINIYNWLSNAVNNGKIFICTSNVSLENVHKDYLQSKIILSRNAHLLEIKGNFSTPLTRRSLKK